MTRVRLERPLLFGMFGVSLLGAPMIVMGLHPHTGAVMVAALVAGAGTELFGLGWNLAMQEHIPDDMLSRAYSFDALGSFVAIPIGQLLFGPLGVHFGIQQVILVGGLVYVAIAAVTLLSPAVRDLRGSAPLLHQRPDHRQVAVGGGTQLLLDERVGQGRLW